MDKSVLADLMMAETHKCVKPAMTAKDQSMKPAMKAMKSIKDKFVKPAMKSTKDKFVKPARKAMKAMKAADSVTDVSSIAHEFHGGIP